MKRDLSSEVTVFVVSAGNNPNYRNCIKALNNQTVEIKINVIKDYHPMSVAFQQMLLRCTTEYYIEVDEDMVLYPNAIELMYDSIKVAPENRPMVVFRLHDTHLDFNLFGVKIYRFSIFKKYPYNLECLSCEVEQLDRMRKDGYDYLCNETVAGEHSPDWTCPDIFERYFNLMEKFKEFKYVWLEDLPAKLWGILKAHPDEKNLYAFLGAYTSLSRKGIEKTEKDFTKVKREEFSLIESYMSKPFSATLYLSSKCNFKCDWCYRQHNDIEQAPDMSLLTVRNLLVKFPGIKSICLCGFGETLLCDNLKIIISELKTRNIFAGLITNGSLIIKKFPELLTHSNYIPDYVSVSLNAHNAEQHKIITKTDTFRDVIEGIRLLVSRNVDTFVSYVCTKESLKHVPEFLKLVKGLGVKTVHLHNVLPHFKNNERFWDLVLTKNDKDLVDNLRLLPESDIVKSYPILISKQEKMRFCQFPWRTIAVNGNGSISICNSVYPCDAKNGKIDDYVVWQNNYCQDMRSSILGEQKEACTMCFRNWQMEF